MAIHRTYRELNRLLTFQERFDYLRLVGSVGAETFGFDRWINQQFYQSREWKQAREYVIVRDNGCDLGIAGYEIHSQLVVHHMNPILAEDIVHADDTLLDPNNLITTTQRTHNAIHYGLEESSPPVVSERQPNDTKLW